MTDSQGVDAVRMSARFAVVLCLAIAIVAIPAVALAAPVTSSNAVATYNNSAVISITATTGVGNPAYVGTRYFFDASAPATISAYPATATVSISTVGSHSLTYFSTDASGVVEAPQTKNFTILDTIKPTSFSDLSVSYLNSAVIHLFASDSVGGSGVANIFHQLDGGATSTATSFTVSTFGTHTLKFWSVDVAGNSETTQTAAFFIDDTIPPVTTSDAVWFYDVHAHITLAATDADGSGVAATYYSLDDAEYVQGAVVDIDGAGEHHLRFYSVDAEGNVEDYHYSNPTIQGPYAPISWSDIQLRYPAPPAIILLTVRDTGDVASMNYRIDSGDTVTVRFADSRSARQAGIPNLGIPTGHPGGAAPTDCACHPGIVPPGHSGGAAPANCACHDIHTGVSIDIPSTHGARLTNCKHCHPSVAPVIMPTTTQNPHHYGQSVGFPGGGACEGCHPFGSGPEPGVLTTTVTVSTPGNHTIEYWSVSTGGAVEASHLEWFTIESPPRADTTTTIEPRRGLTAGLPKAFVLSGALTPGGVGDPIRVYVRKPGSARYSCSSTRLCYAAAGGGATWWYRYTPRVRGTYSFRADFAGDTTRLASSSRAISVRVR